MQAQNQTNNIQRGCSAGFGREKRKTELGFLNGSESGPGCNQTIETLRLKEKQIHPLSLKIHMPPLLTTLSHSFISITLFLKLTEKSFRLSHSSFLSRSVSLTNLSLSTTPSPSSLMFLFTYFSLVLISPSLKTHFRFFSNLNLHSVFCLSVQFLIGRKKNNNN